MAVGGRWWQFIQKKQYAGRKAWKCEDAWYICCCCYLVTKSWLLWSMECSLPDSSVHGISQARILEWVAVPFSKWSSWPRDQTWVSHVADSLFTVWATWATHLGTSKTKVCWNPGTTGKAQNICQVGRFLVLEWRLLSLDLEMGRALAW